MGERDQHGHVEGCRYRGSAQPCENPECRASSGTNIPALAQLAINFRGALSRLVEAAESGRGIEQRVQEARGVLAGEPYDPAENAEQRRPDAQRPDDGSAPPKPNGPNELRACWCFRCLDAPEHGLNNPTCNTMILCPACGNKRCPRASDHRFACTGSNEPGQFGSKYRPIDAPPFPANPLHSLDRLRNWAFSADPNEHGELGIERDYEAIRDALRRSEATPCGRFHVHPAEWDALIELARVAQRYHDETGHGTPGATAQCDPICVALDAWRKVANPDG